jgi:hypothetical protein
MGISGDETFQLRNDLGRIMLGEFIEVVNTRLHRCWELLDVAIVERFISDIILGIDQDISGRRLRHTRCVRRLALWTPCWTFLACHRALSLHA